ncbi:hypothetical protein [Brachyspira intermedia]|uniref:hypothetical protein n=1 Tax=Brachyspira intermedia TaxID=84377 RepID=UPI003005FFF6
MKNRNIFYTIYITLIIISSITILILSILGNKTRIGYIEILKNYTNTHTNTFQYYIKIGYYNKIFRHSDIYGVYVDTNKILDNNNFIKEIIMDKNGSAYGNIISSNKIDNIEYTLKLKKKFIISIIIVYMIILFAYLMYIFLNSTNIVFDNINTYKCKLRISYIIVIMLLGILIRLFWAYQQERLYWDEFHSLTYLNKGTWDNSSNIINYVNIKGYDILKDLTIDDSSVKDCFEDIKRLYKNTNDPFISNLYYTLLRLAFIGREVVNIKNIIMTGTILNCIFFIISFIFLYKILKFVFEDKDDFIILFSLLIMSLSPISISFSMFLRAYQMQETFFVVITYLVINTVYNHKYSVKNLIITTIISGIGYLTLYSSMLFVLILSAMLFINYLEHFQNVNRINLFNPLIKIESYKIILYYAVSFISALFISRLLYSSFFSSLFNANDRASTSLKFSGNLFSYINDLSFNGLLVLLLILLPMYLFYLIKNNKKIFIIIEKDKLKILIFIILLGILYALFGDLTSPFKLERYSATSYILILFIFPLLFSIINNNKIKYCVFIFLSVVYIYNVTTPKNFRYFEKIDKEKFILTENIHVYNYKTFFNHYRYSYDYLNTNLYYTYIYNKNDLNIITNDRKFYFLVANETKYILTNNILKDYEKKYLNTLYDVTILKLEKK